MAKFRAGTLAHPAVVESSGLVASRRHPGVFWTVNDSGSPPAVFAIERDGTLIREYAVTGAPNVDWEDLAIDEEGHLYVADVGNNAGARREVQVYRLDEPDPRAPAAGPQVRPAPLRASRAWRLSYPGKPFDCEGLFVFRGVGYLIAKRVDASPAEIFRFDLAAPAVPPAPLEHVASVPAVRAPVTAADVSADGKQLAILTVLGPYVLDIHGDVAAAATAPARYSRYIHPNIEAACLVEGGVLATTEKRDVLFFSDAHFTPVRR